MTAAMDDEDFTAAVEKFWTSRIALGTIHDFARARRVAPWSTFGAVLAGVVAHIGPHVQLPPIIGSYASLNLFVAVVGNSGDGKDASRKVAWDLLDIRTSYLAPVFPLGSGEGLSHMFMHWEVTEKGAPPELVQYQDRVLVTVGEIDTLTALRQRQSSTVASQLRQAAMGEQLGFFYVDATKRMIVPEHTYRLCLLAGVQPGRGSGLLDDADGGTPQRFVWLPATDPEAPDEAPEAPAGLTWTPPHYYDRRLDGYANKRMTVQVCDTAVNTIVAAHLARRRGQGDALDGHALLTRLKVAAALALLDERGDVNDQDWELAGTVMAVSDRTRHGIAAHLAAQDRKRNTAQAKAEAERAVIVSAEVDEAAVARVCSAVTRKLAAKGGWMTQGELRRAVKSTARQHLPEALERLAGAGTVEVESIDYQGQSGERFRLVGAGA